MGLLLCLSWIRYVAGQPCDLVRSVIDDRHHIGRNVYVPTGQRICGSPKQWPQPRHVHELVRDDLFVGWRCRASHRHRSLSMGTQSILVRQPRRWNVRVGWLNVAVEASGFRPVEASAGSRGRYRRAGLER